MTNQEKEWAKRHDWYIQGSKTLSGNWIVYVRPDVGDDADIWLNSETPAMQFADFQSLYEWAGY